MNGGSADRELADRSGCPVKTLAQWASKGTGPRYARMGRHVRYRLSDVIDWETERVDDLRDVAQRRACQRLRLSRASRGHGVATRTFWQNSEPAMIPTIYDLADAARILGLSESYLRSKLRDRTFAGMKRAGRWAMTEAQIEAAIESMCIDARPADPPSPSGLSKHSRLGRRLHSQRGA